MTDHFGKLEPLDLSLAFYAYLEDAVPNDVKLEIPQNSAFDLLTEDLQILETFLCLEWANARVLPTPVSTRVPEGSFETN